jgi:hypothetical protein
LKCAGDFFREVKVCALGPKRWYEKLRPMFSRRFFGGVNLSLLLARQPVTVAERSKECIVFARSEAGIVGSNPGMDVWYVYVFILCLCCPVFRQEPSDPLIPRPRSPTVCKMIMKLKIRDQGPRGL